MTLDQALSIAVTALATVILVLWKITRDYEKECREDRKHLWETIDKMMESSCSVHGCNLRQRVQIAKSITSTIKEKKEKVENEDSSIIRRVIGVLHILKIGW